MRNNPVMNVDPMGDAVRVAGTDEAINTFKEINDNAMGGYYKTFIDDKGNVSFTKTAKEGEMSQQQKAYHKEISKIIDKKEVVEIEVVEFDKSVVGGSFTSGKIDVDDIYMIGNNNKAMTSGSVLAHEIAEQGAKQTKGYSYTKAHEIGIRMEEKITGYKRNEDRQVNNTSMNSNKRVSGTIIVPYTRGNSTINVNIILEWNNIKEVKEEIE